MLHDICPVGQERCYSLVLLLLLPSLLFSFALLITLSLATWHLLRTDLDTERWEKRTWSSKAMDEWNDL